jgi:hypothetical protein
MGLTDEEVREVTHIAMTVGASRVQVMADAELAKAPPAVPEDAGFVAAAVEAAADGG